MIWSILRSEALFANAANAKEWVAPPDAVCLLHYSNDNQETILCSGILVSRSIVATAAHCLPEDLDEIQGNLVISCGYRGESYGSKTPVWLNMAFAEDFLGTEIRMNPHWQDYGLDFALIRLNKPSNSIEPIRIESQPHVFVQDFVIPNPFTSNSHIIRRDAECRFAGFGEDPKLKRNTLMVSDHSPRYATKILIDNPRIFVDGWGRGARPLQPGDSGGALYCRTPDQPQWTLVGIETSSNQRNKSGFASVNSDEFRAYLRNARFQWEQRPRF